MIARLAAALLIAAASAGASPAAAAAPRSFDVSARVPKACSLTANEVTLTVTRPTGSTIIVTASPPSVTAYCNAATGGTLSFSSTRLQKSGSPATRQDYTLAVIAGGLTMTYTTAASPPPPTTQSAATQSAVLSFGCASGCATSDIGNNSSWTATISLGVSPNP
ncbi:MAG: hypothetical protein ACM3ZV_13435 [Bacillota bacterium]